VAGAAREASELRSATYQKGVMPDVFRDGPRAGRASSAPGKARENWKDSGDDSNFQLGVGQGH